MTNILSMVQNTVRSGQMGERHFFNMVDNLSAQEWIDALKEEGMDSPLLPYLIYTFDEAKISEMATIDRTVLGEALVYAWNGVYDDTEKSIIDLGHVPALRPLLDGSLYRLVTTFQPYSDEYITHVQQSYRRRIKEFVQTASTLQSRMLHSLVVGGMAEGATGFPLTGDHDCNLDDALGYPYLLASIESIVNDILYLDQCIKRTDKGFIEKALAHADFRHILEMQGVLSNSRERQIKDQIDEIEAYIVANFPIHIKKFTFHTLSETEKLYVQSLYSRGLLKIEPPKPHEPAESIVPAEPKGEGFLAVPADDEPYEVERKKERPSSSLITSLRGLFDSPEKPQKVQESAPEAISAPVTTHEPAEPVPALEELVFRTKKKRSFNIAWIVVVLVAVFSWVVFLKGGSESEKGSVIEQVSEQSQAAAFPVKKIQR